jgi:hypothetical protein
MRDSGVVVWHSDVALVGSHEGVDVTNKSHTGGRETAMKMRDGEFVMGIYHP